MAAAARVLHRLVREDVAVDVALEHLEAAALFLSHCQTDGGSWGQRYTLRGDDRSIYRQEDNVAHGLSVIATYLHACHRAGRDPEDAHGLADALRRGAARARSAHFRKGINLFYSTTSIHESAIEQGYTLWTNLAYQRALGLMAGLPDGTLDADEREGLRRFHRMHAANALRHLTQDGRYVRRITPRGRVDRRPDVTLMAPYYFGFAGQAPQCLRASVDRVEKDLWDPELGLLQRYLPFSEDVTVHLHAGNGPWMAYSAIFAQYHARHGDPQKARLILRGIARHANDAGHIPEHVSTAERFQDFLAREWETGLDYRKEFDAGILLPGVAFSRVVEELTHMRDEYHRLQARLDAGELDGIIPFATPLMWSHAEFLHALLDARTRDAVAAEEEDAGAPDATAPPPQPAAEPRRRGGDGS